MYCKEENLWRKTMAQHFKRLPEPKSIVGQALTQEQLNYFERVAASKDAWQVAYYAEVLASNTGLRGCEIKRLRLGSVNLETPDSDQAVVQELQSANASWQLQTRCRKHHRA